MDGWIFLCAARGVSDQEGILIFPHDSLHGKQQPHIKKTMHIYDSFPRELEDLSEISSVSFSLVGTFLHFYGYSIKRMIHRLYSWKCNWKKKQNNKQTKFEIFNKTPQCYTSTSVSLLITQKAELLGVALAAGDEQQDSSSAWIPALPRCQALSGLRPL